MGTSRSPLKCSWTHPVRTTQSLHQSVLVNPNPLGIRKAPCRQSQMPALANAGAGSSFGPPLPPAPPGSFEEAAAPWRYEMPVIPFLQKSTTFDPSYHPSMAPLKLYTLIHPLGRAYSNHIHQTKIQISTSLFIKHTPPRLSLGCIQPIHPRSHSA